MKLFENPDMLKSESLELFVMVGKVKMLSWLFVELRMLLLSQYAENAELRVFKPFMLDLYNDTSSFPTDPGYVWSMPFVWKSFASSHGFISPPVLIAMWASISFLAVSTFSGSPVTSKTGSLSLLGVTM